MPRQDLIQVRRGTAAQWTSANPTLDSGEFGFETDTNKLKCGDGSTAWNSLDYISGGSGDSVQNNYSGTAAPATTDDTSEGYSVGSVWIDVTNDNAYICVDATEDAAVWEQINSSSVGAFEFQTEITGTTTTFDGSQKGLNKVYPQNNASASTITIENGDYSENDVINIERRGQGTLEIVQDTDVRFRGVRDIDNRFFINDANSMVSLICRGNDGTNDVFSIIGNLKRGYTGAATIDTVTNLQSNETVDVIFTGTGYSDNMLVTVVSGNATINSFSVSNNNSFSANMTSSGTDGDLITLAIDNGDYVVFADVITLTDIAPEEIVITTTSTSATWSPASVVKSGSTLAWTLSGDITPTAYNVNDPTIDLSANTGTVTIKVTSDDDLAGLTTLRLASLDITSLDVSKATDLTDFWCTGNGALTSITGLSDLTSLTSIRLNSNGLTGTFDISSILSGVTNFQFLNGNAFTTVIVTGRTDITKLGLYTNSSLTTITGLADCTSLDYINVSSCANLTTLDIPNTTSLAYLSVTSTGITSLDFTGLTGLTDLLANSCGFTSVDTSPATSLDYIALFNNALDQTSVNNLILDADARGLTNGTLNYSGGTNASPSATEDTTNDVLNAYISLVADGWTVTGATPS